MVTVSTLKDCKARVGEPIKLKFLQQWFFITYKGISALTMYVLVEHWLKSHQKSWTVWFLETVVYQLSLSPLLRSLDMYMNEKGTWTLEYFFCYCIATALGTKYELMMYSCYVPALLILLSQTSIQFLFGCLVASFYRPV